MAAVPKLSTLIPALPAWRLPRGYEAMPAAFARMAEAVGAPPAHLMSDFAALAFGPGRISFSDYERLRLYDDAFWGDADRREVAGAAFSRRIARIANFRRDYWALATDRLASNAYLAAHGLPIVPTHAIYREGLATPGERLLRTRDELRQFLEAWAGQPLVATPAEGGRTRVVFTGEATAAADIDRTIIDRTLDVVRDAGPMSWLFQPKLEPHPAAVAQVGDRLTLVRVLTMAGEAGAMVSRAVWRLGGPDAITANLDVRSGEALRLTPAHAVQRGECAPAGLAVPDWPALRAVAIEGARLFSQFGLLGWDIAPTAAGPVIVGVDPAPDLELHQLADRRGLLDEPFLAFLAARRALAAEQRRWTRGA